MHCVKRYTCICDFTPQNILKCFRNFPRYRYTSRLAGNQDVREIKDCLKDEDFYGVKNEELSQPIPATGPDKEIILKKYNLKEKQEKLDYFNVPYGIVRLDPGVADKFSFLETRADNTISKNRERKKRRKVSDSAIHVVSNPNITNEYLHEQSQELSINQTDSSSNKSDGGSNSFNYGTLGNRNTDNAESSSLHSNINTYKLYQTDDSLCSSMVNTQSKPIKCKDGGTGNNITTYNFEFNSEILNEDLTSDNESDCLNKDHYRLDEKETGTSSSTNLHSTDNTHKDARKTDCHLESLPEIMTDKREKFLRNKNKYDINKKRENVESARYGNELNSSVLQQNKSSHLNAANTKYKTIEQGKKSDLRINQNSHYFGQSESKGDPVNESEIEYDKSPSEKTVKKRLSASNKTIHRENKEMETTAKQASRKIRLDLTKSTDTAGDTTTELKRYRKSKEMRSSLYKMTSSEVVNTLYDSIVYNKDDIIALSKPYGLACYGGADTHISISQCLEKLKNRLDPDLKALHLITHLDRDTTGVLLLAKTEEMAFRLTEAYKQNEVIKTFFAVTKGVPKLDKGLIDIPVSEGKVAGRYRMVLKPEGFSSQSNTLKAETQFKVLVKSLNTALVECVPLTGVKHQIRTHLFYGLNTPVLGDHKYSHMDKIAPQKLFPDMLNLLKIRQAEVRYVPLHLHARSVLIPEFLEGRNLYVYCRLPTYFTDNMKKLKLAFKQFL